MFHNAASRNIRRYNPSVMPNPQKSTRGREVYARCASPAEMNREPDKGPYPDDHCANECEQETRIMVENCGLCPILVGSQPRGPRMIGNHPEEGVKKRAEVQQSIQP